MPAPIYIPRRQNPWTNMMPGLLQNLVLQKIGQNMRLKEKEMEINAEKAQQASEKAQKAKILNYEASSKGQDVFEREAQSTTHPDVAGYAKPV
jgi:hypothetical protein